MARRAAILFALVALGVAPQSALATPQDLAATHGLLLAGNALARVAKARVPAIQAKIHAFNAKLARECPQAGQGSPQSGPEQRLAYEVAGALWSVAYGAISGPIDTFAKAVKPLRWSDGRITRSVRRFATGLHDLATLEMPHLCADVGAWRASGYQTIPAVTLAFDKRTEAIEPRTVAWSLLARYEQGADRALAARTMRLETELQNDETSLGFEDWNEVLETLALNQ